MIDLKALQQAFESIQRIGKYEETFLVRDIPVTVRALGDKEQIAIWKYASVALEESEDAATQQEWMHRMKVATLSHAIVQIGDVDLRSEFVSTGESLDNGTPIQREKVEVVRQLLADWGSAILLRMFSRYGQFVARMELRAEAAIVSDPVDFDAEIKRLSTRIQELEDRRDKEKSDLVDPLGKKIRDSLQLGQGISLDRRDMAERVQERVPERVQERAPERVQERAPERVQERAPEMNFATPSETYTQLEGIDPDSSFIDPADPLVLQQMQAQQSHLLALKQAQLERHRQAVQAQENIRKEEVASVPVRTGRTPPHLQAAKTQAQIVGTLQEGGADVPVYRLPSETISSRGTAPVVSSNPVVNAPNESKITNPKFQPPRR